MNHCRNIPVQTVPTPLLQGFRVFSGIFAAAKSIPLQICLKYHPCLRLTLQSRRQIESNKSPLPCSLRTLALNTENPRFARTGGLCSSPRPEDFGRGWVLWSSGFGAYAASGGTARTVPPPLSPVRLFISATLIKFAAPECRSEPGQTLPRI